MRKSKYHSWPQNMKTFETVPVLVSFAGPSHINFHSYLSGTENQHRAALGGEETSRRELTPPTPKKMEGGRSIGGSTKPPTRLRGGQGLSSAEYSRKAVICICWETLTQGLFLCLWFADGVCSCVWMYACLFSMSMTKSGVPLVYKIWQFLFAFSKCR